MLCKIFIIFLLIFTNSFSEELSIPVDEKTETVTDTNKNNNGTDAEKVEDNTSKEPMEKQAIIETQMEETLTNMQSKNKRQLEPKNTLYIELKDNCIVIIELLPSVAPRHVQRIRELSADAFYDNVVWHRVIRDFMAQTGDPTGTGNGGSRMGRLNNEFNNERHIRGTVSMARGKDVDSANSQFFVVTGNEFPELDRKYTVFGRVIEGMECIDNIKVGDSANNGVVKDPDRMITVITGDLLNSKPLNIVKKEMVLVNELQDEKIKQDPKYKKQSVLALLLAAKDIDITSELENEGKEDVDEESDDGININDKLGDAGVVAEAVGDALMENKYTKGVVSSFKDITTETFKNVKTVSEKAGEKAKEDVAARTAEKKKEKALKAKNRKKASE